MLICVENILVTIVPHSPHAPFPSYFTILGPSDVGAIIIPMIQIRNLRPGEAVCSRFRQRGGQKELGHCSAKSASHKKYHELAR